MFSSRIQWMARILNNGRLSDQANYFKRKFQMNTHHPKLLRTAGAVIFAGLASGQALGQSFADASAEIGATIYTPLAISKTANLNFGAIKPGSAAGTVLVSAAGVRSATGTNGPTLLNSIDVPYPATVSKASFAVTGNAASLYTISFSDISVDLYGYTSSKMTVDGFVTSKSGSSGTFAVNGTDTFDVGATLNVGANQAAGEYSGMFHVMVNYQ
jgi:hypothetical protein